MTILRFDPFRDLDRLTNQLASGVRTPCSHADGRLEVRRRLSRGARPARRGPEHDRPERERNSLTVQAQRQPAFGEADQVLVAERPQGSFTRQLVLGEGLDIDQVRADYANGVLHLTIPVKQSSQPRRIEVQTEQSSGGQPRVIDMTGGQQSEDQSQTSG
jgi:HSP20 family protein